MSLVNGRMLVSRSGTIRSLCFCTRGSGASVNGPPVASTSPSGWRWRRSVRCLPSIVSVSVGRIRCRRIERPITCSTKRGPPPPSARCRGDRPCDPGRPFRWRLDRFDRGIGLSGSDRRTGHRGCPRHGRVGNPRWNSPCSGGLSCHRQPAPIRIGASPWRQDRNPVSELGGCLVGAGVCRSFIAWGASRRPRTSSRFAGGCRRVRNAGSIDRHQRGRRVAVRDVACAELSPCASFPTARSRPKTAWRLRPALFGGRCRPTS